MIVKEITEKIIDNFIKEFKKRENSDKIQSNIIDPIVQYAFSRLYPYIIMTSVIFFLTFIIAVAILFFVLKNNT
jgi:hypothetical protein